MASNAGSKHYPQASFDGPKKACDIVMKGGITSGVVYPLTIVELAQQYRFSSVGGTSAGAIAAAVTAAAEYGRATGGFQRVARVPDEVGENLLGLFQPTPTLRPIFKIFVASLTSKGSIGKVWGALSAVIVGYPFVSILGVAPGLALALLEFWKNDYGWTAFGILWALVGLAVALGIRLKRVIQRELPANDFGLCPGIKQSGYQGPGFTDWLADVIDEAAGLKDTGAPLTFGHLAEPGGGRPPIHLAMMTTNLMMRRPHRLPMEERIFLFRLRDFQYLFPARICKFLAENSDPFESETVKAGEYFYFPPPEKLPVIVAARMSLSFPMLISAVPLYARDFTLKGSEKDIPRRCLFSDGGLSSNFPIHFFDHLWPNSPTFAIALDSYVVARNGETRVWLPKASKPTQGILLPIDDIDGLGGFLMRLVDAAKDWQDNLQSTLPGYRERIVHVALKPEEGGLNIAMPKKLVERLAGYGADAGEILRKEFDLDEHRWRRFLIAMARMEQTLEELTKAYDGTPNVESFDTFLGRFPSLAKHYQQTVPILADMLKRARELVDTGREWQNPETIRSGNIPRPDTDLRITSKL